MKRDCLEVQVRLVRVQLERILNLALDLQGTFAPGDRFNHFQLKAPFVFSDG